MGGPSMPGPTPEETQLQREQISLLQNQRELMERQFRNQELIAPLIYERAGILPQYEQVQVAGRPAQTYNAPPGYYFGELDKDGVPILYPMPEGANLGPDQRVWGQTEYANTYFSPEVTPQYEQRLIGFEKGPPTLEEQLFQQQAEFQKQVIAANEQNLARQQRLDTLAEAEQARNRQLQNVLQPALLEQQGYAPVYDDAGNLVAINKTPQALQRADIERQLQERTLAGLRGELPVNPALMRELQTEEQGLQERLLRELGPGYRTSTPGIETLGDFAERRTAILEGARRGDITLGEQLSLARGGNRRADTATVAGLTATPQWGYTAFSPGYEALLGGGSTQATLGTLTGAVSAPYALGSQGFGNPQDAYAQIIGQMNAQRQQQYGIAQQQAQQRAGLYSGLGTAIGGVVGTLVYPGAGTMAGAALGGALGGAGGYYF